MAEPYLIISPYSQRVFVTEWVCLKHPEIVRDAKMKCSVCGSDMESRQREIQNAKNYPIDSWNELIALLKFTGETIIQIGVAGEQRISGVDDFFVNLPFSEIEKLLLKAKFFISVDNFIPHFCHSIGVKNGIVIFSQSNPELVGYKEYVNILKDKSFIRPDHWKKWNMRAFNPDAFVSPEVVANAVVMLNRELK